MSWNDSVEFAIKRASKSDKGAVAAREGILGLPPTQSGETANRCYQAASVARNAYQTARQRRKKPPLAAGTTGNGQWDKALGVQKAAPTPAAAAA